MKIQGILVAFGLLTNLAVAGSGKDTCHNDMCLKAMTMPTKVRETRRFCRALNRGTRRLRVPKYIDNGCDTAVGLYERMSSACNCLPKATNAPKPGDDYGDEDYDDEYKDNDYKDEYTDDEYKDDYQDEEYKDDYKDDEYKDDYKDDEYKDDEYNDDEYKDDNEEYGQDYPDEGYMDEYGDYPDEEDYHKPASTNTKPGPKTTGRGRPRTTGGARPTPKPNNRPSSTPNAKPSSRPNGRPTRPGSSKPTSAPGVKSTQGVSSKPANSKPASAPGAKSTGGASSKPASSMPASSKPAGSSPVSSSPASSAPASSSPASSAPVSSALASSPARSVPVTSAPASDAASSMPTSGASSIPAASNSLANRAERNSTATPALSASRASNRSTRTPALTRSRGSPRPSGTKSRKPAPSPTEDTVDAANACMQASATWSEQYNMPKATPTIAASLAFECLQSVPLDRMRARKLINALLPMIEWQSDLEYLKNPPPDYAYPAVDVMGAIAAVKKKLDTNGYKNHYEFDKDLMETVFFAAHDGHFNYYPLMMSVFSFSYPRALVSFSEDGTSVPVIKLLDDIQNSPETASAIDTINGVPASEFIEKLVRMASPYQDIDTGYNAFFYTANVHGDNDFGEFHSNGLFSHFYQGPNTTFVFENGTTVTEENMARVHYPLTDVVSGKSYGRRFNNGKILSTETGSSDFKPALPDGIPGYPKAILETGEGVVSGYFLEDEEVNDVAVLVVKDFSPNSAKKFQAVMHDFLIEAKSKGKKKIVIDMQGNNGGSILLGYDMFFQFFPGQKIDGFSRWRSNEGFDLMAEIVSDYVKDIDPYNEEDDLNVQLTRSYFNYRYDVNMTFEEFPSFEAKFGPRKSRYTANMAWDLNDPLTTTNETFGIGIEMNGFGKFSDATQLFAAEDIVILYDGKCSSTCTIASDFLKHHGNVKSVVMGGRPQTDPMQGVGGVKGVQVLTSEFIPLFAQVLAAITDDKQKQKVLRRFKYLDNEFGVVLLVNTRDSILRDHVEDGLPAQFVTEHADCRLFWTEDMLGDISKVWKAAAMAAFKGAECINGGIELSQSDTYAAAGLLDGLLAPILKLPQTLLEGLDLGGRRSGESPLWRSRHELKVFSNGIRNRG